LRKKERRSTQRYQLNFPLHYRTWYGSSTGEWKSGNSVDISVHGILIRANEKIPCGRRVEIEMDWPGVYHDKPMMRLFVAGKVIRSDRGGIALAILNHRFYEPARPMERPVERAAVA